MPAESRYLRDREAGVEDQAVRLPYDPVTNDAYAADAERWFLGLYGVADKVRDDRPTSCDLIIKRPWGVIAHLDVKSTPFRDGRLIRHKDERKKTHWCTAYVLVVGEPGSWEYRGWARGHVLQQRWDESLPKPAWAMRQEDLHHDNIDILMAAGFGLLRVR